MSRGVGTLVADVRYGWRGLRRLKAFTLIAALILALGIGATTAVFSIFYAILMRPLPYEAPQQLVIIWASFRSAGNSRAPVSGAILREIRQRNRSLSDVAGIWVITRTFTGQNPEQVKAARVTANFFDVIGVPVAIGHGFTKDEEGGPAIILSNGIFKSRFGGHRRLLGKALPIEGEDNLLIGVLPASFQLHFAHDANVPADVQVFETFWPGVLNGQKQYFIRVIGRMKSGVSIAEAQHDLDRVGSEICAIYPEYAQDSLHFNVVGMQADAVREVRPALTALFAGAAFVLLICCLNLSGLLIARANDRRKEMAIRVALGASRARIIRQLLVESCILCLLGGVAGIFLAWAGIRGLTAIQPERLASMAQLTLSWPVLLFAASSTLGAAMLFGLLPAIESFRADVVAALRAGTQHSVRHLHRRSGSVLVILEVAVTFMLLGGAGLTFKALANMENVRLGFQPHYLLAFQVGGPLRSIDEWQSELAGVPGVQRVGAISHLPFDADIPNWYNQYFAEGPGTKRPLIADLRCITPGYFAAMGTRLLEGRYFNSQDRAGSQQVAIVDDVVARATWPGQKAIGKRVTVEHASREGFRPVPSLVVGVVQHLHSHSLVRQGRGAIYMPYDQSPRSPLTYVLRTRIPPRSMIPTIRRLLHNRNKSAAMAKIRPMATYIARELSPMRFTSVLIFIFAGLALVLAASGIYGTVTYQLSQRLPEFGVRIALGASPGRIGRLIVRDSLSCVVTGVVIGGAGLLVATRWLSAFLYGVPYYYPPSYIYALLLIVASALAACWVPVWRAATMSPAALVRAD